MNKILIVDDHPASLYMLQSALQGWGYEALPAPNGAKAWQQLERTRPDLIIADILMPEMDGFEFCRRIKGSDTFRGIPLIFYTATYTDQKDEQLGLKLGASRFLIKPVEPERMHTTIEEVLREADSPKTASPADADAEAVVLTAYNQALVRKLECKVEQLETLAKELESALTGKSREAVRRRRAEEKLRDLNLRLEKRIRRRTAELAAANKELESFVSAVAHELGAPLRRIESWSRLLGLRWADKLDAPAKDWLGRIVADTRQLELLIDALLGLSKAVRGELTPDNVDLSRAASAVASELHQDQPERAVEFVVTPNMVVRGDPLLLRSVLHNLLHNAWKFTAHRAHARIEFGKSLQGGQPTFFIRDNGAGFNEKAAARLFTPFQRLHSAAEFPGTGIGLATVQRIIRRHGGTVWAEGAEDKGATFYFTLQE